MTTAERPQKPYPEFPLFPHRMGQWAKKIRGKTYYFGVWSDPEAALKKYYEQRDDLQAGREPKVKRDAYTVADLCNKWMETRDALHESGELSSRAWRDYYQVCEMIVDAFGRHRYVEDLTPADFEKFRKKLAKRFGPVALGAAIQRIRTVFNYASEAVLVDRPVLFGPLFKKPSRKAVRAARNERPSRLYEPHEIRTMLEKSTGQFRAMILLAINCAFGQSDLSALTISSLDLDGGWVNFPRPKTGVRRRCALWPETIEAVRVVLAARKKPRDPNDGDILFLTKQGRRWVRTNEESELRTPIDSVTLMFRRLLKDCGIESRRRGFYGLRHTFETIGGASIDQPAVDIVMGHAKEDMPSVYRQKVEDDRLRAVTDYVRNWLFGDVAPADS